MTSSEQLSYAQSLRALGQQLDTLHISAFRLKQNDDGYMVHIDERGRRVKSPARKGLFQNILRRVFLADKVDTDHEISNLIEYNQSNLLWLDTAGKLNRGATEAVPEANVSTGLRALGDFLDRRKAGDFMITWLPQGAEVYYGQKQEHFTIENIHDLATGMYLRRSAPWRRA